MADGQVVFAGDVRPSAPTGFPNDPFDPPVYDADSDELGDWLPATGDFLSATGVAGTQPDGSAGGAVWNSADVFNPFDHPSDIEVGKYEWGSLSLGSTAVLRREEIVIGECGEPAIVIGWTAGGGGANVLPAGKVEAAY